MNRSIRVAGFLCAAVLVMAAAACSTVPEVVAEVNGVKISGEEYQRTLNGFLSNYGLTEESLLESLGAEEAVEYKNNVIDEMVLQELMMQYAQQHDLADLSDDETAEVDAKVESYLEDLRASFRNDVEAEGTLTDEAADKEAQERFDEYVRTYEYTESNLQQQYSRQMILDRVYDDVMAGCVVTDDDVRVYYEAQVREFEETDREDPAAALDEYLKSQDSVIVYVPSAASEEVRYVKHILVQLPSAASAEISNLEAEGETDEAARLRAEAMDELRGKAQEILDEARAGTDFDDLISEYNEDPGMSYYPEGYLVYEGASFDSAFLEDALSLEQVGDISSEPVESSFGYHIIRYESAPVSGPVRFEDVEEDIRELLQQEKRESYWRDAVDTWKEEADIEMHQFRPQ